MNAFSRPQERDVRSALFMVLDSRWVPCLCSPKAQAPERRHNWEDALFIIIPHGVEQRPSAEEETHVMLLEPKATLNTGHVENESARCTNCSGPS